MAIFYLTEQQAWVNLEGDCLIVHNPEHSDNGKSNGKRERKMTVPLLKVEEVVILGNITRESGNQWSLPIRNRNLRSRVSV